ncbi:MAG: hypothetical protein ACFCD0_20035 [Gemmataceae bacterium]
MAPLPITRIVLYKHGVGYFERQGNVDGDTTLALTFKQDEVSDVLKSLTVLDLNGGHISSVSYDSTKPLEQLLSEVALKIPDSGSIVGLLPQIKGARIALHTGVGDPTEGSLLGVDTTERQTGDGIVHVVLVSVLTDHGSVQSFDLHNLASLQILDDTLRRDLDFYLRTQLSSTKKDAKTFTFFAQGTGTRVVRVSYTLEAPVWKATYRIILGAEENGDEPPMIQGWAVVDNTQDEDWQDVQLSLISGLPVSFVHDLYTPRYIRRPEVEVRDSTGVLPPEVEAGVMMAAAEPTDAYEVIEHERAIGGGVGSAAGARRHFAKMAKAERPISSTPTQVREQVIGDLLEYQIEHPVTIKRNQSALVPIVLKEFDGKPVLYYSKPSRKENPMNAVLFHNTTGLTLEGGPVTVLQGGTYVGEAMLETMKPDEERLVPYSVELGVSVLDNIDSHKDEVDRVYIRKGVLTCQQKRIEVTTYTLRNKTDRQHVVFLDHPRVQLTQGREWSLFDTPEPHETTENNWRFRFELASKETKAFVVKQYHVHHQRHELHNFQHPQLDFWLSQRYFDEKTAKTLQDALAKRQEQSQFEAQIDRLTEERTRIMQEQARLRDNLKALADQSAAKELRERYLRSMTDHEDRLEAIDKDREQLTEVRNRVRDEMQAILDSLEYDAVVPPTE